MLSLGCMGATTNVLTLEEFRACYTGDDKVEFWYGEAIPRSVGTWLHSALQIILAGFFKRAGYKTAVELELRISSDFQPKPDVAAALRVEQPYPTRPIEIVVEVVSPDDTAAHILSKCRHYGEMRIGQIFVFDPQRRTAQVWNSELKTLEEIDTMALKNGINVNVASVWAELDQELA